MKCPGIGLLSLRAVFFLSLAATLCLPGPTHAQAPAAQPPAQEPVASIADYSGTVIVLSGSYVSKVSKRDTPLKSRDMVLTEDGRVQIRFNDGATVNLEPYSLVMVLEGIEAKRSGLGSVINQKEDVRRITSYVGKARFKSGSSNIRNCIQTPSAVCTISGSEAYWGSDGQGTSFLQVVIGQTTIAGNFVEGFFDNPGIDAASKCKLHQDLLAAYEVSLTDPAKGRVMALAVLIDAFSALLDNPDPAVVALAIAALEALRADLNLLQEALREELAATPWDESAEEIRELEEELQRLERELQGLEKEEEEAEPFVTSTTTTTTTVYPSFGDRIISTPQ